MLFLFIFKLPVFFLSSCLNNGTVPVLDWYRYRDTGNGHCPFKFTNRNPDICRREPSSWECGRICSLHPTSPPGPGCSHSGKANYLLFLPPVFWSVSRSKLAIFTGSERPQPTNNCDKLSRRIVIKQISPLRWLTMCLFKIDFLNFLISLRFFGKGGGVLAGSTPPPPPVCPRQFITQILSVTGTS